MTTFYYGHIDKAGPAGEEYYFEFHCLTKDFVYDKIDLPLEQFHSGIVENPEQVIALLNPLASIRSVFVFDRPEDTEGYWVLLETNNDVIGIVAQLFVENIDEPSVIYIQKIELLSKKDRIKLLLESKVSLDDFEDASENDIKYLLDRNRINAPEFVSVYNVGQGNCNAICNDSSQPLFYFDLGGGCYTNKHTYASVLDFCFSKDPAILLSHWDKDHYQSAKMNSIYQAKDWIVPKQTIGPVHLKFFLSITGSRLIWPAASPPCKFCWGEVVVCKGPAGKKNHTGLAIHVDISPYLNTISKVLLPADAAYTYIPSSTILIYDGLVATHHGAQFDTFNSPVPSPKGKMAIAYSYGKGNTYGHPNTFAMSAHNTKSWLPANTRETINGHISLTDTMKLVPLSCSGRTCSLKLIQSY